MKKILSLLLTLCLLALLCVPVLAEEECPHNNFYTYTIIDMDHVTVLSFNEKTHTVRGAIHKGTVCDDCGLNLTDEIIGEDTKEIEHAFVNGVCEVCGYKSACTHPETYAWMPYMEDGYTVVSQTDTQHTLQGTIVEERFCSTCGERVSTTRREGTLTNDHNFYKGKCNTCGYINPCKHEHTTRTISRSTDSGARFKIVSYTATTHTALCDRVEEVRCDDCYDLIAENDLGYGELTGDHETSDDKVCEICGYKLGDPIPTATPEPTATVQPTTEPTAAPTTEPTTASTTAPTEKPTAKPGKADVPKTGERSFAPAVAALMLCAAGALLLSRRK